MKDLLTRLLARLRVPPFEGRWTPQALEEANELEAGMAAHFVGSDRPD